MKPQTGEAIIKSPRSTIKFCWYLFQTVFAHSASHSISSGIHKSLKDKKKYIHYSSNDDKSIQAVEKRTSFKVCSRQARQVAVGAMLKDAHALQKQPKGQYKRALLA